MRLIYILILIISIIILSACMYNAQKSDKHITRRVYRLVRAALLATIVDVFAVIFQYEAIGVWMYGLFFCGLDWMIYFLMLFCLEYADDKRFLSHTTIDFAIRLIIMADCVSLVLNGFFGHAFALERMDSLMGSYIRIDVFFAYRLHSALCYLMLVASFLVMVYKALLAPEIYRKRYAFIVMMFTVITILDSIFVINLGIRDMSVLFLSVGGITIYYWALRYIPGELLDRTLSIMVQEMADALILYDGENECIHMNETAKKLFHFEKNDMEAHIALQEKWLGTSDLKNHDNVKVDFSEDHNGSRMHFRLVFQRLFDRKNRYLGSFMVAQDRTEEVNNLKAERFLANHDRLTGLYNKEHFYECVAQALREHPEETFLLICFDIYQFKFVNDTCGQKTGDELLVRLAEMLMRKALPGEVYGRLDNDRFAILIKKKHYQENTFVNAPQEVANNDSRISFPVVVNVGVYEVDDLSLPVDMMCDRAFIAISTIRNDYNRTIAYYDESMRATAIKEQELLAEAMLAIASEQIQIYIQPQVAVSGRVHGGEALVRWIHPQKGMIMPGEFIAVFEKTGMIVNIDQYIWELACIHLKKWKEMGKENMYISINVSPKDFLFMDVYDTLTSLVEKYGIRRSNLRIEITETALMNDMNKYLSTIAKLRKYGFIVEMDDFGSGYSSLNMLKDINVDVLKIDMAFLEQTENEDRSRKILRMIVALSRDLDLPVIMEGVETEEQVEFLSAIGCDMFQGYYFAKPMPVSEFEQKYMQI